jgi:hypothetical protein
MLSVGHLKFTGWPPISHAVSCSRADEAIQCITFVKFHAVMTDGKKIVNRTETKSKQCPLVMKRRISAGVLHNITNIPMWITCIVTGTVLISLRTSVVILTVLQSVWNEVFKDHYVTMILLINFVTRLGITDLQGWRCCRCICLFPKLFILKKLFIMPEDVITAVPNKYIYM